MKNLDITWKKGIPDTTGFLFSFAKALGTAVKYSPYPEMAEDIIATSGFAFRMWADEKDLNTNAVNLWDFRCIQNWLEKGGLLCSYAGGISGQDDLHEAKRKEADTLIRKSIEEGFPVVAFNIGGCEWGLITGYDDENNEYKAISVSGSKEHMNYDLIGEGEIPILSVLTVTGKKELSKEELIDITFKQAAAHLKGKEASENVAGLKAYPVIIKHFEDYEESNIVWSWNMEYGMGTYSALKYYALIFFKKYGLEELAGLYKTVYENWKLVFDLIRNSLFNEAFRSKIVELLKEAYEAEQKALAIMEKAAAVG